MQNEIKQIIGSIYYNNELIYLEAGDIENSGDNYSKDKAEKIKKYNTDTFTLIAQLIKHLTN